MPREILILRLSALLCFGSVGVALISQYVYDMQPCAWCVFQRLLFLLIGSLILLLTFGPQSKIRQALAAAIALAGSIAGVASAWY